MKAGAYLLSVLGRCASYKDVLYLKESRDSNSITGSIKPSGS